MDVWEIFTDKKALDACVAVLWFWRCHPADGSRLLFSQGFTTRGRCEAYALTQGCTVHRELARGPNLFLMGRRTGVRSPMRCFTTAVHAAPSQRGHAL
jgi:hypothetical protein